MDYRSFRRAYVIILVRAYVYTRVVGSRCRTCQLYHNQRVSTWPTDTARIAGRLSTLPQPKGVNLAYRLKQHILQNCQLYHNQRVSTWPTDTTRIAGLPTLPQPKGVNMAHRLTQHILQNCQLYHRQRVSTWPTDTTHTADLVNSTTTKGCQPGPQTQHILQNCQLYHNQRVSTWPTDTEDLRPSGESPAHSSLHQSYRSPCTA